jgi:XTP/dITP diphosphohydrolase
MRSKDEEGIVREHKRVWFLTSNKGKFREAQAVARASGLELQMLLAPKVEIQSETLVEIASYAAEEAAGRLGIPVVTEDAGLFIDKLDGFPGPYSSDVFKRLGNNGILKLMQGISHRSAKFSSVAAFSAPSSRSKCFSGTVVGQIGLRPRGTGGFGFDPIFIPRKGDGRTFAQMTVREKNRLSHRAASFRKLSKWLSQSQPIDRRRY